MKHQSSQATEQCNKRWLTDSPSCLNFNLIYIVSFLLKLFSLHQSIWELHRTHMRKCQGLSMLNWITTTDNFRLLKRYRVIHRPRNECVPPWWYTAVSVWKNMFLHVFTCAYLWSNKMLTLFSWKVDCNISTCLL